MARKQQSYRAAGAGLGVGVGVGVGAGHRGKQMPARDGSGVRSAG
jgi:hypothetical protein